MANENNEVLGEELEGEELLHEYVCMKREVPEEEICESESSVSQTTSPKTIHPPDETSPASIEPRKPCSELRTTTGNILERMITDPSCRRPPCLGKWPVHPPKSDADFQENTHQFRAAQQSTPLAQMCSLRVTSTPNPFRQPAVVGTIGPASWDTLSIVELMEAGMNIARVSMSHVNPCSKVEPFQNIIEASNQYKTVRDYGVPIGIMMDLKGPEIRTGKIDFSRKLSAKDICLKQGTTVRLTSDKTFEDRCTDKIVYVDYDELPAQAESGMTIYISGGEIVLKVDFVESSSVVCLVDKEGKLRSNQKLYIPSLPTLLPPLTDYDEECLNLAVKMDLDIVVVPKTRNAAVIKDVKRILDGLQEENEILVLAKISSFEGLENIDEILRVADGVVIEKDALSLEITPEKVLVAQKEIIGKCNRVGKPVLITARLGSPDLSDNVSLRIQMNDIGGAIVDGADGVILAGETALSDQGAQVVTQLSNVIREAEAATMQQPFYFDLANEQIPSVEPCKAIAMAAVQVANKIHAAAILAVTTSGRTARMLSWFRPRTPVIAISRSGRTARQMNLWRTVIPLHFTAPLLPDWFHDVRARFDYGISYGKESGIIRSGDLLVLVSGFRRRSGFTNCIRIVFASVEKDAFVDNVNQYYAGSKHNSSTQIS